MGAGKVLVEWRCCGCCRLGPKIVFSGERLQKGPIPQEDEISRGSQPGRGRGHNPHSQNELGPRKLQDSAHCHHRENGLHLG